MLLVEVLVSKALDLKFEYRICTRCHDESLVDVCRRAKHTKSPTNGPALSYDIGSQK